MPTFCRHNRFIERCPICSKTLPGSEPAPRAPRRPGTGTARRAAQAGARRPRAEGLRVRHEGRALEDGYRSELVPGLRASADAERLAGEIAFSGARLAALAVEPPGLYGEAGLVAVEDLERASWTCFLLAYLSPSEAGDPFAGVSAALAALPALDGLATAGPELDALLDELPRGPRSSHEPGRGAATLRAYSDWVGRASAAPAGADGAGPQQRALTGDPGWTPERRFQRLFERLALPGLGRGGRYELLVSMGRLGLYELAADALHLSAARGADDETTVAAKRVFGIGDPLLLERRAAALAAAADVPLDALDLALFNWGSPERATMGFAPGADEEGERERIAAVLGLQL